jgi:hypothetical protein
MDRQGRRRYAAPNEKPEDAMGLLDKLFGKSNTATLEPQAGETTCLHTTLTPSWDSVADMGRDEKATGYTCQGCGQRFSPAEGRALRRSEADRVQSELKLDE